MAAGCQASGPRTSPPHSAPLVRDVPEGATMSHAAAACAYSVDAVLSDGTPIRLRAIRREDKDLLLKHFRDLSPESAYQRFQGFKKDLSAAELQSLTELDFDARAALVAVTGMGAGERIVG